MLTIFHNLVSSFCIFYFVLFNWSPACVSFPNHEVVLLQPRTGVTLRLDSVSIVKPYSLVSPPHLLQHPTAPHRSPFDGASLLSVAPASPPQLSRARRDRPPYSVCGEASQSMG